MGRPIDDFDKSVLVRNIEKLIESRCGNNNGKFARSIGVANTQVSNWKSFDTKCKPTYDQLIKISEVYHVSVDSLLKEPRAISTEHDVQTMADVFRLLVSVFEMDYNNEYIRACNQHLEIRYHDSDGYINDPESSKMSHKEKEISYLSPRNGYGLGFDYSIDDYMSRYYHISSLGLIGDVSLAEHGGDPDTFTYMRDGVHRDIDGLKSASLVQFIKYMFLRELKVFYRAQEDIENESHTMYNVYTKWKEDIISQASGYSVDGNKLYENSHCDLIESARESYNEFLMEASKKITE